MCIRDRVKIMSSPEMEAQAKRYGFTLTPKPASEAAAFIRTCLLYTSDAADERSSVDLGGRRIIKKKNNADLRAEAVRKTRRRKREHSESSKESEKGRKVG